MFPNIVNLKIWPVELAYSSLNKDFVSLSAEKEINNKIEETIESHCLKKQGIRIRSPYGLRTLKVLQACPKKEDLVLQRGCIKIALPFSGILSSYQSKCQYMQGLNNHLRNTLNNVVVYVVTNSSDELVSVASRSLMYRGRGISLVDLIIDLYYRYFVLDKYNLTNVVGFVFMDYEDSNLFLRTVLQNCYDKDKKAAVQKLKLGEACKLFFNPLNGIKVRFIPSSKELEKLFSVYQNEFDHISLHADQRFTPNSYSGVPVYLVSNKWLTNKSLVTLNPSLSTLLSHDFVFFTYLDALKFCNIIEDLLLYGNKEVESKPSIVLFNFEEILLHLKDVASLQTKVHFLPPYSVCDNEKLILAELKKVGSSTNPASTTWEYLSVILNSDLNNKN
uniref:Uncharacterized protein n=1 Tax=Cyanidium caldarium TaxID=2771 RepID=Q9TLY6_CYACA|nr:hypothetical protein JXY51_pgp090 [Cyanidium caldarium]AAF12963.1 unknown [Cyanidium caldarium]WDB00254.1 hypothetical protein CDCA019_132 [Cyanidium caldarium]